MTLANVTLQLPEPLYRRLLNTAQATRRPVEEVIVHAVEVGSPPAWEDVPDEFQTDIAAMDRLDDAALWRIAGGRMSTAMDDRYEELLDRSRKGELTDSERVELQRLREEADRIMLCKAHAAALLRWRGATAKCTGFPHATAENLDALDRRLDSIGPRSSRAEVFQNPSCLRMAGCSEISGGNRIDL